MKCETCKHRDDCMQFFCNESNGYNDYIPYDYTEQWQIEYITVPFTVLF